MDEWYSLVNTGRTTNAVGQIHLRMKFNRGVKSSTTHLVEDGTPYVLRALRIIVHGARKLPVLDTQVCGVSCKPRVKLELDRKAYTTEPVRKDVNPNFNDQIFSFFDITNLDLSLNVTIEGVDNNKPVPDLIGSAIIPLRDFDYKKKIRQWYQLKNKVFVTGSADPAEIELSIHWENKHPRSLVKVMIFSFILRIALITFTGRRNQSIQKCTSLS